MKRNINKGVRSSPRCNGTGFGPSTNNKTRSLSKSDDTEIVPPLSSKLHPKKPSVTLLRIGGIRIYVKEQPGIVTFSDCAPTGAKRASEGIWYVIREGEGWNLFAYPFGKDSKIEDHSAFWEQIIAPWLAAKYKLTKSSAEELALHPYGFPRGRVTKVGKTFTIYHGDDWAPYSAAAKVAAKAFHLPKTANWVFDEHETRNEWDCAAIESLLPMNRLT
ncbi:hypothetical protein M2103_001298 [Ereboglobus sp. PH5-5]|uniref:hypothetical protein n=1 Tax=Ereboglobus sp. PH5-5 TaxID=2940529 RepID=UPI002406B5A3|nr:hypothetical protein [Ereboglobus sp. PH5-5]MDF9833081.1 hypothetical protein [Ereboglobus sp. PH5-5]